MLQVVGGTYLESCISPWWFELFGSGFRASLTARTLGTDVEFHTYIDELQEANLNSRAAFRVRVHVTPTSPTIRFSCVHSLSTPSIVPPPHMMQRPKPIQIKGDTIL